MVLVFFDLETCGLDEKAHEVAMLAAANEDLSKTFEVLVRVDESRWDPAAPREWYDRDRWAREAVSLADALGRFEAWLREVSGIAKGRMWPVKLAGHYAAEFDKRFLLAAYAKVGRDFPCDYRVRDTLQLALWLLPGRQKYDLRTLALDLCGRAVDKREGAAGDVRATAAVVAALRTRYGRTGVPAVAEAAPEAPAAEVGDAEAAP